MSRRELDLDRALADLAASLEFPPTPDLAAAVTARLDQDPVAARPARGRRWLGGLSGWRRLAAAGLAVALLAMAVLAASPGTREAVARRLGLRGIGVELGGPPPSTATTTSGGRLDLGLGERVALEEARRRVSFPVLVPHTGGLERPDAVFVSEVVPPGGRVDLVWRARPGLPASGFTDAGLLITEFRGQTTPEFIKKVAVAGQVEFLEVDGEPAYWFSGEPHFFTFRDEQTRLAGNALIWQRGELTLRLEGELSKEEALRIAESMR